MNDLASALLVEHLQNGNEKTLWVADENTLNMASAVTARSTLSIISNRFDIYSQACAQGHNAQFSDYDFSSIPNDSLDKIIYRVSKERAVVHHIANEAQRILKLGGCFCIAGEKNDGIKGFTDKIGKLFGAKSTAKKHGSCYIAEIYKHDRTQPELDSKTLDDKQYTQLRQIGQLTDTQGAALDWWSKPGQFGWNKTDLGSALLIQQAEEVFSQSEFPSSLLDLGCGYGYLTLMTKDWPVPLRYATDNNAAAIAAAAKNFEMANLEVTLLADDCGTSITKTFDALLCNPPFHQGFANDFKLTQKFLSNASRLVSHRGVCLFVVNQFIPLEKLAAEHFRSIEVLTNDGQFKVVELRK